MVEFDTSNIAVSVQFRILVFELYFYENIVQIYLKLFVFINKFNV
jgi:hypothetical protein